MNMWFSLFISLLLTTFAGFMTPLIICGLTLTVLEILSNLPEVAVWGNFCYGQVCYILSMFGNGSASEGIVTIALTCGFVGFLFESLNFYRYQTLISQPVVNNHTEPK